MTYPYGTKGAPVVGNGLGGLPRRAATGGAAAATSTRYDVQEIANYAPPSMPLNPAQVSPPLLIGGKGLFYFSQGGGSPTLWRHTFDYSAAGITNSTSTVVEFNQNISQLPNSTLFAAGGRNNFCWSHRVSATQTLFKYTNLRPFLVTYSGTGDSTFAYPDGTPAGFAGNISSTSDSFFLPNGNFVVFGHTGTTTIRLAEYTPSLTFVRAFDIGNITSLAGAVFTAAVKKTRYGYVVAVTHQADASVGRSMVVTLNPTCTAVISSVQNSMQNTAAPGVGTSISSVLGEEGAMIFWSVNNSFGVLRIPIGSDGVITAVPNPHTDTNYTLSIPSIRALAGSMPEWMGCTKFAESIAPTLFSTDSSGNSHRGVVTSARRSASDFMGEYIDMQLTPMFNLFASSEGATVFDAQVQRTVNAVFQMRPGGYGQNLAGDENGFMYISQHGSTGDSRITQARLLRRIPR